MTNTCLCYCLACFAGIMGDFTWWPLVKQVGPVGGIVQPFVVALSVGEGGQTTRNRLLTSIIKDFQHRLLTNVETTDVKSLNVNIGFPKPMLSKLHKITTLQLT